MDPHAPSSRLGTKRAEEETYEGESKGPLRVLVRASTALDRSEDPVRVSPILCNTLERRPYRRERIQVCAPFEPELTPFYLRFRTRRDTSTPGTALLK